MKNLFVILVLCLSISCSQKEEIKKDFTKLEKFLIDFKNRNPNTFNNDITEEKSERIFKKELTELYKSYDSIFYYHPLKYTITFKEENKVYGIFKMISEEIDGENFNDFKSIKMYVDVIMEIPKTQIDTLVEGKYYQIVGNFKKYRPPFSTVNEPWEPYLMNIIGSEYHLGNILLENISIKEIEWKERMKLKGKIYR
jgi:hypothetical protein